MQRCEKDQRGFDSTRRLAGHALTERSLHLCEFFDISMHSAMHRPSHAAVGPTVASRCCSLSGFYIMCLYITHQF